MQKLNSCKWMILHARWWVKISHNHQVYNNKMYLPVESARIQTMMQKLNIPPKAENWEKRRRRERRYSERKTLRDLIVAKTSNCYVETWEAQVKIKKKHLFNDFRDRHSKSYSFSALQWVLWIWTVFPCVFYENFHLFCGSGGEN